MSNLILLRDLPGVREIEELCWNPENLDPPRAIDTFSKIDVISARLFGIWETDTYLEELPENPSEAALAAHEEWEAHFSPCYYEYEDEVVTLWNALGWDLSNENGEELFCAEHFSRQIIAAIKGLLPEAVFFSTGNGTRPEHLKSADNHDIEQFDLEEKLKRDAAKFGIII